MIAHRIQAGLLPSAVLGPDQGWLVLTHGVGPMRVYVIGTLLLDLDDPTRVVGLFEDSAAGPRPG